MIEIISGNRRASNTKRKEGGVVYTEILLPVNAPAGFTDRAVLWNAVVKIENAKNAQLAREIELALPVELTREQNISLVREYVNRHFVTAGICTGICIHDKNGGNPHAHIMLTMRPFGQGGEWGAKQKKEYILEMNRPEPRNGGRHGRIASIPHWSAATTPSE